MLTHRSLSAVFAMFAAAVAVVALAAAPLAAGTITYFAIHDDSDSGLSSAKTYTHALDFGNNTTAPVATVNGVVFDNGSPGAFPFPPTGSATVGTGSTNQPNTHYGNTNANVPTESGVYDLLTDFVYNASNTVVKVSGLTVGQTYDLRLYQRQWDAGGRPQRYGFDTNGVGGPEDVIPTLDPDHAATSPPGMDADNRAHAISYTYTAQSPTLTITADQLGGGTYHLYGLTNEVTGTVVSNDIRPVPSLHNSGVDALGKVLSPGSDDPHYTITSVPASSTFVVPASAVVQANNGAWLVNDPVGSGGSSWTSTVSSGSAAIDAGTYVTRTTFDLSGFVPETARVYAAFAADDTVQDVLFNGTSLGVSGAGFSGYTEFEIPVGSGFRTITNTLEFVWANGADGPGGLRVEALALAERRKTTAIPGLFNTGVDDNGDPLPGGVGSIDPHYTITENPNGTGPDARVEDAIPGAWVPNSSTSQWIGPDFDTAASAGGDYSYETTFDLTGFYPATAEISGVWATDNAGLDILLNGVVVHSGNGGYGLLTGFTIPIGSPFVEGINTLTFRLNNAGVGYTGLRVEDLVGTAVRIPEPSSILLLGLAGVGLLLAGRRRRPRG